MRVIRILAMIVCGNFVFAQNMGLFNGKTGEVHSLEKALSHVVPGNILIIGEKHGNAHAQKQQLQILQELRNRGLKVSVGMEFLSYLTQNSLDQYREGKIDESGFLKAVSWGSPSFDFYKDQVLFPNLADSETTIALNAPRNLTGKVAQQGFESLNDEEKYFLPPQFQLGRDSYKLRFKEVMPHLQDPLKLDNYFAAQSIWDDTMAWTASEFIKKHQDQVLVIIVGEFHVEYGGGLPDRLKNRGISEVFTITQLDHLDYSNEELIQALVPSYEFGPRSDYIWVF
ncbi:MAG: ChaN family lipoprotein [Bdellovibrionales bacterium]|nr:ChaN family lipoprotein [Bdellovibrionales bacterium]